MTARNHNSSLGNADTLRLDLSDDRKVLLDFAAMRNVENDDEKRCDLLTEFRANLVKAARDYFYAGCISHHVAELAL